MTILIFLFMHSNNKIMLFFAICKIFIKFLLLSSLIKSNKFYKSIKNLFIKYNFLKILQKLFVVKTILFLEIKFKILLTE